MSMTCSPLFYQKCLAALIRFQRRYRHELVSQAVLANIAHRCGRRAPLSKYLKGRVRYGAGKNQMKHLLHCGNDKEYKSAIGLTKQEFTKLYNGIADSITHGSQGRQKRSFTPKEKLLLTLTYLKSGSTFSNLSFWWMCNRVTLGRITHEVCQAIIQYLEVAADCRPGTTADWENIADEFWKLWQLPHCLGAVDGKHIGVKKFGKHGSLLFNYKGFNSIILLAFVDARYRIIHFNVGAPGSRSDGGVFEEDRFGRALLRGKMESWLPVAARLPGDKDNIIGKTNYFFVGDNAFRMHPHLIKPYTTGDDFFDSRTAFTNYRLSRARVVVENVFGQMSGKWNILNGGMTTKRELSILVVKACCHMHNFIRLEKNESTQELVAMRAYLDEEPCQMDVLTEEEWKKVNEELDTIISHNFSSNDSDIDDGKMTRSKMGIFVNTIGKYKHLFPLHEEN